MTEELNWDKYFLLIASVVRLKSKDRSTRVGAVIVGPDRNIISTGYNGFGRGIDDTVEARHERPLKYLWTEHAERNAIYNAARHGINTKGAALYLVGMGPPTAPCADCARGIIQSGIQHVVAAPFKAMPDNWSETFHIGVQMMQEAGVTFHEHPFAPEEWLTESGEFPWPITSR